ncbi:MAG: hypothetical protein R3337_03520 [Gammaproteobacteria bacterium]|nr:hypothetical protein [Gammaproteobacteria bacterium]
MSLYDIFMITPDPVVSALVWFLLLTVGLYLARTPMHQAIKSSTRVLHNAFRISAVSVLHAERKLGERNRTVLLNHGQDSAERIIEREIERMDATVRRDLAEYPSLHRKISEILGKIEEDYKQTGEIPPSPLAWTEAVQAVAKLPSKSDPMVVEILEDIHKSLVKAHDKALVEYRKASAERHGLLKNLVPYWRNIQRRLDEVDKHINSLLERSEVIAKHIEDYKEILAKSDRALRILSSSALNQFFISAFVLAVAVGGAMINFSLIARPMAEMVGGQTMVAGFEMADVAALVIILVEVSMGLFLMESLRITRLFPVIGALKDTMRQRMIWITFSILFILASVEAGLAFMREMLLEDELATSAILRGDAIGSVVGDFSWITTAAQMCLGFILPFALVFVAIPLESFVHATRTVLGLVAAVFLRSLAYVLRLIGNVSRHGGSVLRDVYDLFIFIPLSVERMVKSNGRRKKKGRSGSASVDVMSDDDATQIIAR